MLYLSASVVVIHYKEAICQVYGAFAFFACIIAAVVTTTSIILSASKSIMETFWYQLTQVHLEKCP